MIRNRPRIQRGNRRNRNRNNSNGRQYTGHGHGNTQFTGPNNAQPHTHAILPETPLHSSTSEYHIHPLSNELSGNELHTHNAYHLSTHNPNTGEHSIEYIDSTNHFHVWDSEELGEHTHPKPTKPGMLRRPPQPRSGKYSGYGTVGGNRRLRKNKRRRNPRYKGSGLK